MVDLIVPLIAVVVIVFALVAWNLILPLPSAKNADFLNYVKIVAEDEIDKNEYAKPIDEYLSNGYQQVVTDVLQLQKPSITVGPRSLESSDQDHYVTLTFYVEYGNHQQLPELIKLLRDHNVDKAVFFVDKSFEADRPFIIESIKHSGYKVLDWDMSKLYDESYAPSLFHGVVLSDRDLLSQSSKDYNAAAFLDVAVHYNHASVVAFTPKIMSHKLVLEKVISQNGLDLIFTDENLSTGPNAFDLDQIGSGDTTYGDQIVELVDISDSTTSSDLRIRHWNWTIEKLQKQYPSAITYLKDKNAYLLTEPLVIDKGAELHIFNAKVLLRTSTDKGTTPSFLEIRGKASIINSTVSSWDPALNGPDPNGYHPRPYITVKNGGTLDIHQSKITHLGYSIGGVSDTRYARSAVQYYNTSGFSITNSIIAFNYYGFYSAYTTDYKIIGNEVYGNTRYGLDPHTGSTDFIVDSNYVHDNGNQGIICSLQCENVTVTNNLVEYNVEGIGLHWLTNSSIVKDNIVRYNEKYGIFIQKQSFNNIVEDNIVVGNGAGVGLLEGSTDNIIRNNIVADNLRHDIYTEPDSTSNTFEGNAFSFEQGNGGWEAQNTLASIVDAITGLFSNNASTDGQ
jgi:mannuronan 5-epimerase